MVELSGQEVALHSWKLICQLAIIRFNLHKTLQVKLLLPSLGTLVPETVELLSVGFQRHRQRTFGGTYYFTQGADSLIKHRSSWLFWLHYVDLPIVVFLKELLVRHLDEHVVVNFVGTTSWGSLYSVRYL